VRRVHDNPRIIAVIFDADGVVVDSEKIWDATQEEFAQRHRIPYERTRIKALLAGRSQTEAVEILKTEYGLAGETGLLSRERMDLAKRKLESGVEFVPGFCEFLQRIQPTHKTCVATSMPEELLAIVDGHLKLSKLFDHRIYSLNAVGYRSKPNPDIFLHAADQLGVPPARCLVIEDAPNGIEAARRAGMKCVGLTTTFDRQTLSRADHIADSFEQIDPSQF
jgi:beta-phosphoglucomutase